MKSILLTRDQFRTAVFARDGHRCVVRNASGSRCEGYYIDNGTSVCPEHHIGGES